MPRNAPSMRTCLAAITAGATASDARSVSPSPKERF